MYPALVPAKNFPNFFARQYIGRGDKKAVAPQSGPSTNGVSRALYLSIRKLARELRHSTLSLAFLPELQLFLHH